MDEGSPSADGEDLASSELEQVGPVKEADEGEVEEVLMELLREVLEEVLVEVLRGILKEALVAGEEAEDGDSSGNFLYFSTR